MWYKIGKFLKNELWSWNWFEAILILGSTTLILISSLAFPTNAPWWETMMNICAGFTGIVGVILAAKGKISAFIIGSINSILYIIIALTNNMYSSIILHLVIYLPLNMLGVGLWFKKRDHDGVVLAKKMSLIGGMVVGMVALIVWAIYFVVLLQVSDHVNSYAITTLDSMVLIASIVAIGLMLFRYVDQWYLWLLTNTLNVVIWITTIVIDAQNHSTSDVIIKDVVMMISFSASFINAVYGFIKWMRLKQDEMIFTQMIISPQAYQQLSLRAKINYKFNLWFTKKPSNNKKKQI